MTFSPSPTFSFGEESDLASADYDDTMAWFISDTDSTRLQSGVSPPTLAPGPQVGATIGPVLLLTQHQDLENCPNDAAPIQHL